MHPQPNQALTPTLRLTSRNPYDALVAVVLGTFRLHERVKIFYVDVHCIGCRGDNFNCERGGVRWRRCKNITDAPHDGVRSAPDEFDAG